jgi:hypothetical protein
MAIKMVSKVDTFCIFVLFAVALAAAGAIQSQQSPDGGVQWLPVKPWSCCIGRCCMYHFNASARPSKWPATEVHSFVAAGFFAWHNCS